MSKIRKVLKKIEKISPNNTKQDEKKIILMMNHSSHFYDVIDVSLRHSRRKKRRKNISAA